MLVRHPRYGLVTVQRASDVLSCVDLVLLREQSGRALSILTSAGPASLVGCQVNPGGRTYTLVTACPTPAGVRTERHLVNAGARVTVW